MVILVPDPTDEKYKKGATNGPSNQVMVYYDSHFEREEHSLWPLSKPSFQQLVLYEFKTQLFQCYFGIFNGLAHQSYK